MKLYVTRHGQPQSHVYLNADYRYPAGDPPLTPLGRAQAEHLGAHMKELGFHGKIFSSPYARAMETAEIIAEATGTGIDVLCGIREIMLMPAEAIPTFRGMTGEEITARYPAARVPDGFPDVWWSLVTESEDDADARVKETMQKLLPTLDPKGEYLFVCHGSPMWHLREYFGIGKDAFRFCHGVNCALCLRDTATGEKYANDVSFLPDDLITSNQKTKKEIEAICS